MCQWFLPISDRNHMMMVLNGNVSRGHNFSPEVRAVIFTHMKAAKNEPRYGVVKRVQKRIRDENPELDIGYDSLKKTFKKYRLNGFVFYGDDERRSGRPRILTAAGQQAVLTDVLNNTQRGTARTHRYESTDNNKMIKVSRTMVHRVAHRGGLVVSTPKVIRIGHHFSHHLRMRMLHAQFILSLTPLQRRCIWYSDEMSFPVTLSPNIKNNIMMVKKGDQSTTNLFRTTKGSTGKCFSLFWTISYEGVQCQYLYENMMDVKIFHEVMLKFVKPAVAGKIDSMYKCGLFFHDHVTNSQKLHDSKIMDSACGKGCWLKFSPPLCREQDGFINMPAVVCANGRKIKAHQRIRTVAKKHCVCNVSNGKFVPSSSPDNNLIEYTNGFLRQIVWNLVSSGEFQWKGSVRHKMSIVMHAINIVNEKRSYFSKLYDHHVDRCNKIIASNGAIL